MAVMSVHHPLAFAFGILGNIISFLVYLAPVPTFWRIYRRKSTECFRSLPYLVALFSSVLWLYYAMLKKDALLLITINSFGCVIETIYICMYIAYAPREKRISTIRILALIDLGLFSFILIVTQFLVKASARVIVLGWINVAINVSVFAAPLSIVAQVIRTRSVEFMPLPLSLFLTLSAIAWFFYGLFSRDMCVALPNVLGFILGLLQMLLYAMYKNANKVMEETKLPDDLKTIVILSTLGVSEVMHPVEVERNVMSCENTKERDDDDDEQTDEEPNKHDKLGVEAPDQLQPNTCEV